MQIPHWRLCARRFRVEVARGGFAWGLCAGISRGGCVGSECVVVVCGMRARPKEMPRPANQIRCIKWDPNISISPFSGRDCRPVGWGLGNAGIRQSTMR